MDHGRRAVRRSLVPAARSEVAVGELTNIWRAWRESQHEIRALRGWLQASEAENARACARIRRTAGNLRKS